MNEHYLEQIEQIKKSIRETDTVVHFLSQKRIVQNKKDLILLIEEYHQLDDISLEKEKLKKQIYLDEDFIAYKQLENELFYFTLAINNKLKQLTRQRRCNL